MAVSKDSASYADYLKTRDKTERLQLLARMRTSGAMLPISLAEDVLALDIGTDEKLAVLEATGSSDGRALEHFLTDNIFNWHQDLAALAVRLWSQRTDNLFWFRQLAACRSPLLPQRVLYTIVDLAFHSGGRSVLQAACATNELEGMSPAFHGLLLHRALQWQFTQPRLTKLALSIASELSNGLPLPDNKATPAALAYLLRFYPENIQNVAQTGPWLDFLSAATTQVDQVDKQIERLGKFLQKPPKTKAAARLVALWPPLWSRHQLGVAVVAPALAMMAVNEPSPAAGIWEMFAGVTEETLAASLQLIADDNVYAAATAKILGLFPFPTSSELLAQIRARIMAAADPAVLLSLLPLRLRLELTEPSEQTKVSEQATPFSLIKREEQATLSGDKAEHAVFSDYFCVKNGKRVYQPATPQQEQTASLASRKMFFDLAYNSASGVHGQIQLAPADQSFWSLLADAWKTPGEAKLLPLAQAARQEDGLFKLCYLNALGRFVGLDQAALKTLEFIRTTEEDELRAVIQALGGIGTPRAAQELVSILTRPNITPGLQMEACGLLEQQDLANLQNELRSAIKDIAVDFRKENSSWEVRDAITLLLKPTQDKPSSGPAQANATAVSDQQLDTMLSSKIQNYRELSSEVKRALRTSQYFHIQVTSSSAPESIDLSPVIDMQYKALELLFRETFEEACSKVIHKGVLQRRLDIIGYARPIPRAMDEYESFVAMLPTVREIPFFSKFKLRKMLRAICQFRPGRRFTLDGLKAFALFFLCFSRAECRYGLAGMFPLGFATDADLAEFCKQLHIFQDFRNRAAHEGFHPDASNDINGIWRHTAEIVQNLFKAKAFMDSAASQDRARGHDVQSEKKVS